jgi:hypothetical protein
MPLVRLFGKILYSRTDYRCQYNTARELCMLYNRGYRYTHRICNTYCFSTKTVVGRRRLSATLYVRCLHCNPVMDKVLSRIECRVVHMQSRRKLYLLHLHRSRASYHRRNYWSDFFFLNSKLNKFSKSGQAVRIHNKAWFT